VRVLFAVAVAFRSERSQVDQAADVRDVDPGAPGNVLDRELHGRSLLRPMMAQGAAVGRPPSCETRSSADRA